MTELVTYFGYGANRDPRMIAAILGKQENELVGREGVLVGYELAVQTLAEIPGEVSSGAPKQTSPRDILRDAWGEDFQSYVVRPNPEGRVAGVAWQLTPDEVERMKDWELLDFGWHEMHNTYARTDECESMAVITEAVSTAEPVDRLVDGIDYPSFLDDVGKFQEIADRVRREYDERLYGPEGNTAGGPEQR